MSRVFNSNNKINYNQLKMEQALQTQITPDKKIELLFSNEEHIKVCTAVVNNPIFIEIQHYTLKKYMQVDYEFIVFNDAKDFPDFSNGFNSNIKNEIIKTCERLNIKCINIKNVHYTSCSYLYYYCLPF